LGYLTVNVDFNGRPALLIGAGEVGRRKLSDLVKAGARITVVEPRPDLRVRELAGQGRIRLEPLFSESLLDDSPWVFIALPDPDQARELSALARGRGLMVNVADRPGDCGFIMPAVADLSPLRLAVSTDGASPALSARIATELRVNYRGHGLLAAALARLRPAVFRAVPDPAIRRALLFALGADQALPRLFGEGRRAEAWDSIWRIFGLLDLAPLDIVPLGPDPPKPEDPGSDGPGDPGSDGPGPAGHGSAGGL
jgi:precorrin-2 dehydrogenase/sirohydrochlorin ferrochelatase